MNEVDYKQPPNPEYFFTVHSAWCPPGKSDLLEVKLLRPELSEPAWKDNDGKTLTSLDVGNRVKMSVKCNEDVAQNAGIVFRLYPEGHEYITLSCDTKNISHNQEVIIEIYEPNVEGEEQHIYDLKGKVKENKLKVQWQADYRENEGTKSKSEIDEKGCTVPEYRFYVRHFGFKSEASPAAKLKCNFVERAINDLYTFHGVAIELTIPTFDEMLGKLPGKRDYIENVSIYPTVDTGSKKVVLVGFHARVDGTDRDKQQQRALQNVADILVSKKAYRQLLGSKDAFWELWGQKKYVFSGAEAEKLIKDSRIGNNPITELYFSTHGTCYAIDFSNPTNNIYIEDREFCALNGKEQGAFEYGSLYKNINVFRELVSQNYLVPNVTITLGGCFNGAQRYFMDGVVRDQYNQFDDDNEDTARRFLALNHDNNKNEENFAYLLSKKIPAATIIAPMTKNNSGKGIELPVVYQNGLRWAVPLNEIHPEDVTTIYPLAQL